MDEPIENTAYWLLSLYWGKIDGYMTYGARKRRTYGEKVIERMDQVFWKVLGRTHKKLEDRRRRRGRTKTSLQTPTECTLTDPSSADSCSTVGTR